jgi:hypothetical protein
MDNYRVQFTVEEREAVVSILSSYNDIIINNLDDYGANITIQNEQSNVLYQTILERIEREVRSTEIITIRYKDPLL